MADDCQSSAAGGAGAWGRMTPELAEFEKQKQHMRATLRRKGGCQMPSTDFQPPDAAAEQQPQAHPEDAQERQVSNGDDVMQWADRLYETIAQGTLAGEVERAKSPLQDLASFEASVRRQLEALVPGDVYESDATWPEEHREAVRNVALRLQLSVTERNVEAGLVIRVLRISDSFEKGVLSRMMAYW